MIPVTRLNGSKLIINCLLIETIEETPDTIITLTTGKKFVILEKGADVVSLTQHYIQSVEGFRAAFSRQETEDD